MAKLWKTFRALISVLLLLAVLLPAAIYVLLGTDFCRDKIRLVAQNELSKLLDADVTIGRVEISPFNRATVTGISISIDGDTIAGVETMSAGFKLFHFLLSKELIIEYALLDDIDLSLRRQTPHSPLNIDRIIRSLRKDNSGQSNDFSLRINTVVIRHGSATYDVETQAPADTGMFDPSHIAVRDLAINADIPLISKEKTRVDLSHLSFRESSGFTVNNLIGDFTIAGDTLTVTNFELQLPHSIVAFQPTTVLFGSFFQTDVTSKSISIYPPDFTPFAPVLSGIAQTVDIALDVSADSNSASIRRLVISDNECFDLNLSAELNNLRNRDSMTCKVDQGTADIYPGGVSTLYNSILGRSVVRQLSSLPSMHFVIDAEHAGRAGMINVSASGAAGNTNISARYFLAGKLLNIDGIVGFDNLDLGILSRNSDFGTADGKIAANVTVGRRAILGNVSATVDRIEYRRSQFANIEAYVSSDNNLIEANVNITDPLLPLKAYAIYTPPIASNTSSFTATASLNGIALDALGLDRKHKNPRLWAKINVNVDNADLQHLSGFADVSDILWTDDAGDDLSISRISLRSAYDGAQSELCFESPYLNASMEGCYDLETISGQLAELALHFVPAAQTIVKTGRPGAIRKRNNFDFDISIAPDKTLPQFFGIPFQILDHAAVNGLFDSASGYAYIHVDAPYLLAGNKIIEHSVLFAQLDMSADKCIVYGTTQFPTGKGDMSATAGVRISDNTAETDIDWSVARAIPLNGHMGFVTHVHEISPGAGNLMPLRATVDILPGTITFGDELWTIASSTIDIGRQDIGVDGFRLDAGKQLIAIDGIASASDEQTLAVTLSQVSLLPVFETLEINNALIGGRATGVITASELFTSSPRLQCPDLHVDSISYNRCVIGNADIVARWDSEQAGVRLDADISGLEGRKSFIGGYIFPMREALDITFDADSVPVGFLRPFMEAFTSDVSGRASGKCRLFGTFKEIDLEGRVFADNVGMHIDFTNTSYTATDSVYLTPGKIRLSNVTIRDSEGHTAKLNGTIRHTYFKAPVFSFDVSQARNFLSYNISSRQNPDWYGKIYGNGGAKISGSPGVIDIGVDMTTTGNSTFTFVLSDRLDAEDYSFLTFRDVTPDSLKINNGNAAEDIPEAVRSIKNSIAQKSNDSPSDYNIDIAVDITPAADITLVMDPAGGDRIKAVGSGNLRMVYNSVNNDLNMWGKYVVSSGSYRFTLQDIIIKDFTIREGSTIQFDGDPYGVKTQLAAYYATNANLSDLDESFLQDKDIARTNVPVHAMMYVNGDIRQPQINFDLEFPTLTTDTYRKVRSIVSTDDMMNRQIIYLLALNRFYTPDYMSSTTKGSELFSVASSTIAGQLGNMLGKLSDNWSIAPNLRSDRGNFSDIEVDVALSSRLLNNRLLFNGNFGYRDKTLNTNQFIGDFDIEYLLNKTGNWRLKAYNRYNDRNYYVRSAQTTQGIGIMFRRDFDSLTSFLRRKPKEQEDSTETQDIKK